MSEQNRYYWLKFPKDFFSSKRIKKLRGLAGGDTFTIIYLKMQLKSLSTNGVLEYTGIEPSFAEEVALDIDEGAENVGITINYLLSCGLMEKLDEKHIVLPYVVENTGSETASAQRGRCYRKQLTSEQKEAERERVRVAVQKYREDVTECNERVTNSNERVTNSNERVTNSNERVTNVELEIEKEIDKEIEIDKSKNKPKHRYGQYKNVMLTDDEMNRLFEQFGEDTATRLIDYLDEAIEMKGYKYKSHYIVITKKDSWVQENVMKHSKAGGIDWENA